MEESAGAVVVEPLPESLGDEVEVNVVPEQEKEELQQTITRLQEEIIGLRLRQRYLDAQRREALDKILDAKGSIRVFCRVRPPATLNHMVKIKKSPISVDQEKVTIQSIGCKKEFNVDRVFDPETKQEDIFAEVEPIVRSALDGHNVCILAYGQTGTGKTFTMEGTIERPGIVPRAIEELFQHVSEDKSSSYAVSMSMLEVYMGSLRDLLAPKKVPIRTFKSISKSLSILCKSNGSVEIEGLTDVEISEYKQAYRYYVKGKRSRSTSWTNVNETSSRSHCLTRITIKQTTEERDSVISKLWMVDLGGSERLLKTGAAGQTLVEGKAINLSLSALGDVISALKKKHNHIPYRNSKLTQILSDTLGDGSKVLMIVHVSASEADIGETTCSLSFAKRVRAIESRREVSKDLKNQKVNLIASLNQEVDDTEEQLKLIRNKIEKTKTLVEEKIIIFRKMFETEDQKGSPRSPLILRQEETTEKSIRRVISATVPRFMTPTVCSRQRQCSVLDINSTTRRSMMGSRNSTDFFGSQSVNRSECYLKMDCRKSRMKPPS